MVVCTVACILRHVKAFLLKATIEKVYIIIVIIISLLHRVVCLQQSYEVKIEDDHISYIVFGTMVAWVISNMLSSM